MYHDQAHLPVKIVAFKRAAAVAIGVPVNWATVDHGCALDIAWRGQADENVLVETIRLVALTVIAGTAGPQKATLTLDVNGREVTKETTGNGPVDAIFNAIHAIVPHTAKLSLYQVHAVTEGTDAQAEVSVRLEEEGYQPGRRKSMSGARCDAPLPNPLHQSKHGVGQAPHGGGGRW